MPIRDTDTKIGFNDIFPRFLLNSRRYKKTCRGSEGEGVVEVAYNRTLERIEAAKKYGRKIKEKGKE